MWFIIPTVVRTGLNLCIFYIFDHTCSGLKKSKFYGFLHVIYFTYSGWKSLNFDVQMFQELVHYYYIVFSHVVYHIYSG